MRYGLSLSSMFLCLVLIHADDPPKDGNVKSARGKCSVVFPAKPTLDADKTSDTYVLGENDDKHAYVMNVGSLTTKADLADEAKIKGAFSAMYTKLVTSLGTKASRATQSTFGPGMFPTRYYEFDLADGVYWTRVVMTPDAIISVTVTGPKEFAQGEKAQAFLKSLKVDAVKK
ncbi:MAG TPA: hypothetical protein PLN21_22625 [Gemmatales bacterium]|nr:hypothetical protein [Gemmatales bacterium]